ncbi:MAG: homoserine kinase [Cyanobacteria bacterium]|nr:homoserine kinase [Cyanobacteriota bacterium]MDW8202809.1 homoserine kinase [Cyanobacteriota bacterium SKYGB_h_bin112]
MADSIMVTVPATTANIGAGFDCLGAALTLTNQFTFTLMDSSLPELLAIEAIGLEASRVKTDAHNLVYRSFAKLFRHIGKPVPPVNIKIELGVPLSRGLGSSATAIVGGLVGANYLAGSPLRETELLHLAIAIEGHPDNVVPALLGGCRLAVATGETWVVCDVPWHESIVPIVAIPEFELSTSEARRALPSHYSRADAIFNAAHVGLLLRGLETGDKNWLRAALDDRIHQPYRKVLIPGFDAVYTAALDAGAYGLVISGAGPTLLALAPGSITATVESVLRTAWQTAGITVKTMTLDIEHQGTIAQALPKSASQPAM